MKITKGHWSENEDGSREDIYWWWCPGCSNAHCFDGRWQFNGNFEKPTFTPSYLTTSRWPVGATNKNPAPKGYSGPYEERRCHSYVTDGQIQFLADSTHKLAGQTVEMPDIPKWLE